MYLVSLDFLEINDGGLSPLVDVTITANDQPIYEGKLEALYSMEEKISFECEPTKEDTVSLKVTYSMSIDVGNEAMGTFADFELVLASKAK